MRPKYAFKYSSAVFSLSLLPILTVSLSENVTSIPAQATEISFTALDLSQAPAEGMTPSNANHFANSPTQIQELATSATNIPVSDVQTEQLAPAAADDLLASASTSAQDLMAPSPLLVAAIPVSSEQLTASQVAVAIGSTENIVAQEPIVAQNPQPTDAPAEEPDPDAPAEEPDPNAPASEAPPKGTDPNAPVPDAPPTEGTDPNAVTQPDPSADGTGTADPGVLAPPTAGPNEVVTIPKSSAIIVSFPAELMLDPKRKNNVPITLPLLQPIVDSEGQVVAPAKSLVSAQLKSMKGGDLIEVISVVVGGRVIPINALGTFVPAQNKQEDVAALYNGGGTTRLNNIFNSLQGASIFQYGGGSNFVPTPNIYDALNLAVNLGVGLTGPVTKLPPPFVSIPQGSVYILTLASPVTVPKRLVQTGVEIRKQLGEEGGVPAAQ